MWRASRTESAPISSYLALAILRLILFLGFRFHAYLDTIQVISVNSYLCFLMVNTHLGGLDFSNFGLARDPSC